MSRYVLRLGIIAVLFLSNLSLGEVCRTRPTVQLSSTSLSLRTPTEFTVRVEFNCAVIGVESSDLRIAGGAFSVTTVKADSKRPGRVFNYTVKPQSSQKTDAQIKIVFPEKKATSGRLGNLPSNELALSYDITKPTVTVSSNSVSPSVGPFDVAIEFSEDIKKFERQNLTVSNASILVFSGAGRKYTAKLSPLNVGNVTVRVLADAVEDTVGNKNSASSILSRQVISSKLVSVTSPLADGWYGPGQLIPIHLVFDSAVQVSGRPELFLNVGKAAVFERVLPGDEKTVVFNYTVASPDFTQDLEIQRIELKGGSIGTGNIAANLSLPSAGTPSSLSGRKNIQIDGVVPKVVGVTSSNSDGRYRYNQGPLFIEVVFDKDILLSGVPSLQLNVPTPANFVKVRPDKRALVFSYTVGAGDVTPDLEALRLHLPDGAAVRNERNIPANITLPKPNTPGSLGSNKNIEVSAERPKLISITSPVADGTYGVGTIIPIHLVFDRKVISRRSQLALNLSNNGWANDVRTGDPNIIVMNYQVKVGEDTAQLDIKSILGLEDVFEWDGKSLDPSFNLVADPSFPEAGKPGSLGFNKKIQINTVAPKLIRGTSSLPSGSYGPGQTIPILLEFDRAVKVESTRPSLVLNSTDKADFDKVSSADGKTLLFNFRVPQGREIEELDWEAIEGASGILSLFNRAADCSRSKIPNETHLAFNKKIRIKTTEGPEILIVTSPVSDGHYVPGQTIPIHLTFDVPIKVTGNPKLTLNFPSYPFEQASAAFAGVTSEDSKTMIFNYTITGSIERNGMRSLVWTKLLDWTSIEGGTITDFNGLPAMRKKDSYSFDRSRNISLSTTKKISINLQPRVLDVRLQSCNRDKAPFNSCFLVVEFDRSVVNKGPVKLKLNQKTIKQVGNNLTEEAVVLSNVNLDYGKLSDSEMELANGNFIVFRYEGDWGHEIDKLDYISSNALEGEISASVMMGKELQGIKANLQLPPPGSPQSIAGKKMFKPFENPLIKICAGTKKMPASCPEPVKDSWGRTLLLPCLPEREVPICQFEQVPPQVSQAFLMNKIEEDETRPLPLSFAVGQRVIFRLEANFDYYGTPKLRLNLNGKKRYAEYLRGRGKQWYFSYTVQEGDEADRVEFDGPDAIEWSPGSYIFGENGVRGPFPKLTKVREGAIDPETLRPLAGFRNSFSPGLNVEGSESLNLSFRGGPTELLSITPSEGPVGSRVLLKGRNFTQQIKVFAQNVENPSCRLNNSSEIECQVGEVPREQLPLLVYLQLKRQVSDFNQWGLITSSYEDVTSPYAFSFRILSNDRQKDLAIKLSGAQGMLPVMTLPFNRLQGLVFSGQNLDRVQKIELVGMGQVVPCNNLIKSAGLATCDSAKVLQPGLYNPRIIGDENEILDFSDYLIQFLGIPQPKKIADSVVLASKSQLLILEGDFDWRQVSEGNLLRSINVGTTACKSLHWEMERVSFSSLSWSQYDLVRSREYPEKMRGRSPGFTICQMESLAPGEYPVSITDTFGQKGVLPFTLRAIVVPKILGVNPSSGKPDSFVNFQGEGFSDGTTIEWSYSYFGFRNLAADDCQVISDKAMRCKVPYPVWGERIPSAGIRVAFGAYDSRVSGFSQNESGSPVNFLILPEDESEKRLVLSEIEPTSGGQGTLVTLIGEGFNQAGTQVTVRRGWSSDLPNVPLSCQSQSASKMVCTIPNMTPGEKSIVTNFVLSVRDSRGVPAEQSLVFQFLGEGDNLAMAPTLGPVGTQVTLSGKPFRLPVRVLFQGFPLLDARVTVNAKIISQAPDRVVFEVPPCAGAGPVTLIEANNSTRVLNFFGISNPVACELLADATEVGPVVLTGTAAQLGQQQGQGFSKEIGQVIETWVKPILGMDTSLERTLRENARQLGERLPADTNEELRAMASASNQPYEDVLMGNVMNDALTLSGVRTSCSTFVAMPNRTNSGGMIFGRNLDFIASDSLRPMWRPVIFKKTEKLAVLSVSVPGLAGIAGGVNEKGVAISHNTSFKADEPSTPAAVASLFMIRKVLEEAKTAREAVMLFSQQVRTASANITITDGKEAFVLEAAPMSSRVVAPFNQVLFSANHFVHPEMKNEAGKEDGRWPILSQYASIDEGAENYRIGIATVRNILDQTGLPNINVLAFIIDYKSKRLYFGSNPERAVRGDLKYVDLINFLKD